MCKKLLFNGGGSIDVPFEEGSVGNMLVIPKVFSNSALLNNQYGNGKLSLQYLTGEDAGYITYTPNMSIDCKVQFKKKDGTVFFTQSYGNIGDNQFLFEDKFKIVSLTNFKYMNLKLV